MGEKRFVLAADHVALLRAANVSWNDEEWGAPGIDPKRPFGNGDRLRDMFRILVGDEWDEEHDLPAEVSPVVWAREVEHYVKLYAELATALQVVLAAGSFEPGTYVASKYGNDWRLE